MKPSIMHAAMNVPELSMKPRRHSSYTRYAAETLAAILIAAFLLSPSATAAQKKSKPPGPTTSLLRTAHDLNGQ